MTEHATYDWERWWIPTCVTPQLDVWGMFHDPAGTVGKYLNSEATRLAALDDVPCLLLLGEPGMGKTTELGREATRLEAQHIQVVDVELGSHSSWPSLEGELTLRTEAALSNAGDGRVVLVLDGLDEAALEIRRLADDLPRWLHKAGTSRLCLRIASRKVVSRLSYLTDELGRIWPNQVKRFELAPLTQADIEMAAVYRGLDGVKFVDQVTRRGVGSLAARPITLELLLASAGDGSELPESRHEIYEIGVRELARERNERYMESGRPKAEVGEVVEAAERLAAVLLLAGRSRIVRQASWATPDDRLSLDDTPASGINLAHPDDVWESALLVHNETDSAQFAHRTVAEFLAARYLTGFGYEVQRRLLADPNDREVVTPQLAGVAEWLSYSSPDVFNWLVEMDVDTLLNPDLTSRSDDQRRHIGQAVVDSLAHGHAVTELRFYGDLAYDGLDNDLRPLLSSTLPWQTRLEAVMIAEDNKVTGLDTELLRMVDRAADGSGLHDYNEDVRLGVNAIHALTKAGGDEARERVVDLAFDRSISRELRIAALPAALDHLATDELCARLDLTHAGNRNREFLGELCNDLRTALEQNGSHDLGVLTGWLSEHIGNAEDPSDFLQLAAVVFRFALRRHDQLEQDTWDLLGSVYAHVIERTGGLFAMDLDPSERPKARRTLVLRVLQRSRHPLVFRRLAKDGLIARDDLEFWLAHYAAVGESDPDAAATAERIVRQISQPIDEHRQIACRLTQRHPVLRHLVDELFSAQAITEYRMSVEAEAKLEAERRAAELFSPDRLEAALEDVDWSAVRSELERKVDYADLSGPVAQTSDWQEVGDTSQSEARDDTSISRLAAWQQLDETQRSRVVFIAWQFLAENTASEANLRDAETASAAVALLADANPSLLRQMPAETLVHWTPIVTECPGWSDTSAKLLSAVVATAPEWAEGFVISRLRQQASSTFPQIIQQMGAFTTDAIVDTLAELVISDNTNPTWTLSEFLRAGLERGPDRFADLCQTIVRERPEERPEPAAIADGCPQALSWSRAVTAAHALACSDQLRDHFDSLLGVFQASTSFASDVIQRNSRTTSAPFISATPIQRAELILWARDTFPQTKLYAPGQAYSVDRRIELASDLCRHLAANPSPDNLEALEYIADQTGRPYDRAAVHEMRRAIRRDTWQPPPPADVAEILHDLSRRIISTSAQLLELLVETIKGIDHAVERDTTVRRQFWHRQQGEERTYIPYEEDEFSDLLANRLQEQLTGVVVKREVQVQSRLGKQTGQRIDIDVSDVDHERNTVTCRIEVKCNWNEKIYTAITEQLAERYLQGPGTTHGIYLVAWYDGQAWRESDSRKQRATSRNKEELLEALRISAADLEDQEGVTIAVCLVDLTLEQTP